MRFCNQTHAFYVGVDLHARTMYLYILDQAGTIVLHQEGPSGRMVWLTPVRDVLIDGPANGFNLCCRNFKVRHLRLLSIVPPVLFGHQQELASKVGVHGPLLTWDTIAGVRSAPDQPQRAK